MLNWLVTHPDFADIETRIRFYILRFVAWMILISAPLFLLNYVVSNTIDAAIFIGLMSSIALSVFLLFWIKKSQLRIAAYVLLYSLLLNILLTIEVSNAGLLSPAVYGLVPAAFVGALLIDTYGAFLYAAMCILGALFAAAQTEINLNELSINESSILLYLTILTIVVVSLTRYVASLLRNTVAQLNATNAELQQEIDERKAIQDSLAKSEARYRNLFNIVPMSVYSKDRDGRYLSRNNYSRSYYWGTLSEGLKDNVQQPEEIAEQIRSNDLQVMESGREMAFEEPFVTADGSLRMLRSYKVPLKDDNGEIIGILGASKDITEEKRAASERDLFFTMSADLQCILIPDGYLTRINPAGERLLGYTEKELMSRPIIDIIHEDDVAFSQQEFAKVISGESQGFVNRFRKKTGESVWISWSFNLSEQRIFAVGRDVTQARELEKQRVELEVARQLLEAKEHFVSLVSHELRNPLAVILTSSQLLKNYGDRMTAEKRIEKYQTLEDQSHAMSEMVDEILLLGRLNTGTHEVKSTQVDVCDLCNTINLEFQQRNKHVTIQLHCELTETQLQSDEFLLRRILVNLLSNAIKYSDPGSSVEFQVIQEATDLVIIVRDHGIGIPLDEQDNLFQPFQRASNVDHIPGTGLGLVIVRRSVEILGGTLDLQSTPNVGTTITVRLPYQAQ